ncbi:MAG: glycosyltransferase family 4 protein [Candidatus Aminicenantes bacterium]|nr:glycosyltransferase family 4 protein [Candidatus Aminicenantes bacterium]
MNRPDDRRGREGSADRLMKMKNGSLMTGAGLAEAVGEILRRKGIQAAVNELMKREVALGLRKPTLAVYDHAFHFIGGAQKYGLTMISALKDLFDITILANRDIGYGKFREWYDLDLSSIPVKVIPLPYFDERKAVNLDPALVSRDIENPFHRISRESGRYDVFVNNSMNEMVFPLACVSVLICHFPERRPRSYFYADQYTRVVCNSRYTAEWIGKKWGFAPHRLLYPPVDMEAGGIDVPKKKIILSATRFEPEGFKRQREMIGAFLKLCRQRPEAVGGWKFILAGGSQPGNPYLAGLKDMIAGEAGGCVELKVNVTAAELKSLYREAALFWHMCGVKREDPGETEHFGMTTVEAMQNAVVPLVYDGGGLPEIVDHGVNGFLVGSTAELLERTLALIGDPAKTEALGRAAWKKSRLFSRSNFETTARSIFGEVLNLLVSPETSIPG